MARALEPTAALASERRSTVDAAKDVLTAGGGLGRGGRRATRLQLVGTSPIAASAVNGEDPRGIHEAMPMRGIKLIAVSLAVLLGCSDSGGGSASGGGTSPGTTTGAEGGGGGHGGSGGDSSTSTSAGGGFGGSGGDTSTSAAGGIGGSGDDTSTSASGGFGGSGNDTSTSAGGSIGGSGGDSSTSAGGGIGGSGGDSSTSTSAGGGFGGFGGSGGEGGSAAVLAPCGTQGTSLNLPEAFLDVGHDRSLARLFISGGRVLSWDYDRWILWDTDTRAAIADGHAPGGIDPGAPSEGIPPTELPGGVALRGGVVLIQTDPQHAFELRSAVDGSLLASVTAEYDEAGLATDGSYAWVIERSANRITLFSAAGVERWSVTASHHGAIYAAPDALRIGPLGTLEQGIAVLPADGSPPTVTPAFSGTFHAWFQDGERFLTTTGTTVRVYSKAAMQESIVNLASTAELGGTRDYLWTFDKQRPGNPLKIYRVGGGDVPVAEVSDQTYTTIVPTERALGVLRHGWPKIDVIDLRGAEVTRSEHELSVIYNDRIHIDRDLRWAVSTAFGAISHKGTLADPDAAGQLGCGAITSVGGSPSGRVALATSSGKTLVYDTAALDAGPWAVVPFYSSMVRLSADGSLLAARAVDAAQYRADKSLRLFSLPDGAERASLSRDILVQDYSMSLDGATVGRTYYVTYSIKERVVSDWSGNTLRFQDNAGHHPAPLVSPDGRYFVVSDDVPENGCGFTQFYEGSALVNAVPGCALGWLDDSRVLVQTYARDFRTGYWKYDASTIYDELGNPVAAPPLPMIPARDDSGVKDNYGIQPVSETVLYSRNDGVLYDIETGAALATSAGKPGSVAGAFIVYPCSYGACAKAY